MMNVMGIGGFRAVIKYDPEIEMFRGEFTDLNGGADFYAGDIEALKREGAQSLKVFLDMCEEDGVEPRKSYSGKFNVRVSTTLHEEIARAAAAEGKSLNQWVAEVLDQAAHR
ncbi:type II toxin-antitoxin system HicB family antitoxin [Endothiovibrio diazotrophicus]